MSERPCLDKNLDSKTFKDYYYLKEELINFCRENDLKTTGRKLELTERIANFLDTGKRTYKTHISRKTKIADEITPDTIIQKILCVPKNTEHFIKNK